MEGGEALRAVPYPGVTEKGHGNSDRPTIPQLTIAGDFIGGSDIMMEMFDAGELEELVTEKGLVKAGKFSSLRGA